jgi:dihydroorotase
LKKLFKNVHLYDPAQGLDGRGEILVEDGRIAKVAPTISETFDETVNLGGRHLFPGFVDIHVHFREPGEEHKETIESGARAAAAGGFTSVCMMANTKPVNDSVFVTKYMLEKAKNALVRVSPVSAASRGLEGAEMVNYGAMIEAGCVAVSDDGRCVMNAQFARKVLEYLTDFDVPFIEHCEDGHLSCDGAMNEGNLSFRKGLKGVPHAAEDVVAARDISLARTTSGRVHLAHLSSRHAVEDLRAAKAEGLRVTGEVTPHHLFFNESKLSSLHTNFKMAPPLRTEEDRQALLAALNDGTIDAVATDHAPHSREEKNLEFPRAPNGVIGLETAFAALHTLVLRGELKLDRLIHALTAGPAAVMGFRDRGALKAGAWADFAVCDLGAKIKVAHDFFASKSRNSAFLGEELTGAVTATFVGGNCVFGNVK